MDSWPFQLVHKLQNCPLQQWMGLGKQARVDLPCTGRAREQPAGLAAGQAGSGAEGGSEVRTCELSPRAQAQCTLNGLRPLPWTAKGLVTTTPAPAKVHVWGQARKPSQQRMVGKAWGWEQAGERWGPELKCIFWVKAGRPQRGSLHVFLPSSFPAGCPKAIGL